MEEEGQIVDGSSYKLYFQEREIFFSALESCTNALTIFQQVLINYSQIITYRKKDYLDGSERLKKLYRDSVYVKGLLKDIKNEVESDESFSVLIKLIEEYNRRNEKERVVLANYQETQKLVENLLIMGKNQLNTMLKQIENFKDELAYLKHERKQFKMKTNEKIRYVSALEETQCEQISLQCKLKLKRLITSLQSSLIHKKNDKIISNEIQRFLKENICLNQEAVEDWREKYNHDMEMYETKNNGLRNDIESKQDILEILQSKFDTRQKFINNYLEDKKREELNKEAERYKCNCAIKIQSWWRGIMVRRKLGPYKVDEKKKKRTTAKPVKK